MDKDMSLPEELRSIQQELGKNTAQEAAGGISERNDFLNGWADTINAIIDDAGSLVEGEAQASEMLAMALMQRFPQLSLNLAEQIAQQQVQKFSDKSVDGHAGHTNKKEDQDIELPDTFITGISITGYPVRRHAQEHTH